jgi:hypothetical protein
MGAVVLRHGSRRWHNVYGVGGVVAGDNLDRDVTDSDVWMYGLGMGPSWQRGATTFDLDLMAWHVIYGGDFDPPDLDLLTQARLVIGHRIGPIGLVAGVAANVYLTTDATRDRPSGKVTMEPAEVSDVRAHLWPSGFVGLRL